MRKQSGELLLLAGLVVVLGVLIVVEMRRSGQTRDLI
jgi:hypothetical protein